MLHSNIEKMQMHLIRVTLVFDRKIILHVHMMKLSSNFGRRTYFREKNMGTNINIFFSIAFCRFAELQRRPRYPQFLCWCVTFGQKTYLPTRSPTPY